MSYKAVGMSEKPWLGARMAPRMWTLSAGSFFCTRRAHAPLGADGGDAV